MTLKYNSLLTFPSISNKNKGVNPFYKLIEKVMYTPIIDLELPHLSIKNKYLSLIDNNNIKFVKVNKFVGENLPTNIISLKSKQNIINHCNINGIPLEYGKLYKKNSLLYRVEDHILDVNPYNPLPYPLLMHYLTMILNSSPLLNKDENYPYFLNFIIVGNGEWQNWTVLHTILNRGYFIFTKEYSRELLIQLMNLNIDSLDDTLDLLPLTKESATMISNLKFNKNHKIRLIRFAFTC